MEAKDILGGLAARFGDDVLKTSAAFGDPTIVIRREALGRIANELRNPPHEFGMLLDLTCVDYPERAERFEMVYHLYSIQRKLRLRIKCALNGATPVVDSLTPYWKSASWMEREVFDMFGVRFEGHPDLRRLFMNEEFEGHPLRKDYPLRKRQPMITLRK